MRRLTPGTTDTERVPDLRILARAMPDLWPEGRPDLRLRVAIAVALLVVAKAATLTVPYVFGWATDALAPGDAQAVAAPIMLVLAYGAVRLSGTVLQQGRDAIFASVTQHALRGLALRTFTHVHRL